MPKYYVGLAACGCIRPAMIDDHDTTPNDIADFAKRQAKMKRRMEHVTCAVGEVWQSIPGCAEHAAKEIP